jgi:hypothetical protein
VLVEEEGAKYWERIVRDLPNKAVLPSGKACEFVLVRRHPEKNLSSFYMMENKVWNELFAEFNKQYLEQHPELATPEPADPEQTELKKWPTDWAKPGADKDWGRLAADYPLYPRCGRLSAAEEWRRADRYLPPAMGRRAPFACRQKERESRGD